MKTRRIPPGPKVLWKRPWSLQGKIYTSFNYIHNLLSNFLLILYCSVRNHLTQEAFLIIFTLKWPTDLNHLTIFMSQQEASKIAIARSHIDLPRVFWKTKLSQHDSHAVHFPTVVCKQIFCFALFCREQGLKDTEYRCLFSIGSVRMKSDEDAHALRCFEQALQVARHGNKKFDEADALAMLGKVFWTLYNWTLLRETKNRWYGSKKASN